MLIRASLLAIGCAVAAAGAGKLAIVRANLHQIEDGPAVSATGFIGGDTIFFSTFVEGFQVSTQKRVLLSYRIEALDSKGVPLVEPVAGKVDTELSAQDKDWKPKLRMELLVPPLVGPGQYKIRVNVTDELAKASASHELAFSVRGRSVEPSDTLVVRNFGFFRSDEESRAMDRAAYRPGDTVWCRFDLTGYKLGEGNRVHVSYVVSVISASGRTLFTQQEPSVDQSQSFYPKRFSPSLFNLSLTPDLAKSEYTIVVRATDHVGQQSRESRHTFLVE